MDGKQKGKVKIVTNLAIHTRKATFRRAIHSTFDVDSIPIGIDTCTSATVSGTRHLFIGELEPVHNVTLKGVGGKLPIVGKGTLRLTFLDDKGHVHEHLIYNAYYAPRLKMTLLSPRQWSQQGPIRNNGEPVRSCQVNGNDAILRFEHGIKTVEYDSRSNLPLLFTKPGFKQFDAFITSQHVSAMEARLRPTALTIDNTILPPGTAHERLMERNNLDVRDPFGLKKQLEKETASSDSPSDTVLPMDFRFDEPLEDFDTAPHTLRNLNETDKRTLMLRWHYRLGHMPFRHLRAMAKKGLIDKRLATIQEMPLCAGCQFGKQSRRQWRHRSKKKDGSRKRLRKARRPGEVVSVDTMSSTSVPGLMQQMKGKPTLARYHYATVFVDHYSGLEYVHLHENNDGDSVLAGKLAFERFSHGHGVKINHYHCDNGVFANNAFRTACKAAHQTISFCGVNAHHQSGRAEKRIRDLRDCARSMLLRAKHNWPAAITAHLWPFALVYASVIRGSTLREGDNRTPLQIFLDTSDTTDVNKFHTFGCPIYNLEPQLQSGNPLPNKWCDRSRIGIFLGLSREHASSVSLVLNPDTGLVSPQFHVKHDEKFETIDHPAMKNIGKWQGVTEIHRPRVTKRQEKSNKRRKLNEVTIIEPNMATNPQAAGTNATTPPTAEANAGNPGASEMNDAPMPSIGTATPNDARNATGNATAQPQQRESESAQPQQRESEPSTVETNRAMLARTPAGLFKKVTRELRRRKRDASSEGDHDDEASSSPMPSTIERKQRKVTRTDTHRSISQKRKRSREEISDGDILVTCNLLEERKSELELMIHTYRTATARRIHADELVEQSMTDNPFAFAATAADEDTMYLHQARKEPDWNEFQKAMVKELQDHRDGKHWKVIPRSQVPEGQKVMRGVWSMKRKRRVGTGEIYKWKARLCIDGSSQQKGVNYWDTYSPVVSWETFRSLLTLAILNNWETRQIDFVLAFPQAKVDCPMFMEVPQGCNVDGSRKDYVLSLQKNLYGAKQASRVWFNYLSAGLKKRGFKQSKVDQAVFYKGQTIFIVYVDDGILIGPDNGEINNIIKSLKKDYNLTDEGDLNEYLGIKVERAKKGKARTLTQPTLIKRILKTVGLSEDREKGRPVRTPATKVLHKDVGGHARKLKWDYRSVIGMLNWLTRSTRPDILFAVSQVGRFMAFPKKSHEDAVMRICAYLRDTKDKGMIMKPKETGFKVYADADFAGGYNKHNTDDPSTAKSRTAYHVMFNDCLIFSHSKLQTEIALSTTEAEYICLSQALRTVLVLMRFFKELSKKIKGFKHRKPEFQCTAYEDNKGAIELAQAPRMRPRTKHINLKYHHFRNAVDKGMVKIEYIDTHVQLADIGTKPLEPKPFEQLRKLLIGW